MNRSNGELLSRLLLRAVASSLPEHSAGLALSTHSHRTQDRIRHLRSFNDYAGRDYSHRKEWVLERLQCLSAVFAVDICAYAVMSNENNQWTHVAMMRARTSFQSWEQAIEELKTGNYRTVAPKWKNLSIGEHLLEVQDQ